MRFINKALFLTVGLSISAFGADKVPVDQKGNATLPEYAGSSVCEITSSTGTNPLLCYSGPAQILRVIGSSVAATDALVFRDSATANGTSTVLFTLDLTANSNPNTILPRVNNGLCVKALTAPTGAGPASRPSWSIIYRPLDRN